MLELKAVYFGLKGLCRNIRKTTAAHSIKNMDSYKSISCDKENVE